MKKDVIPTEIGDLATYYREGSPTVIVLSGIGNFPTKENFATVIEKIPEHIGILTIDFPNSGESPLANQIHKTFQGWISAIEKVLESFHVDDYILLVHSISGLLALELMRKKQNCKAFIGIEPSTKAILEGKITYSEFAVLEEIASEMGGYVPYLQTLSRKSLNHRIYEKLWHGFKTSVALNETADNDFKFYPDLRSEDFKNLPNMMDDVTSVIFSQGFRKDEYLNSEYMNQHPDSKVVLTGDNHYLHWSDSQKIIDTLIALVGGNT